MSWPAQYRSFLLAYASASERKTNDADVTEADLFGDSGSEADTQGAATPRHSHSTAIEQRLFVRKRPVTGTGTGNVPFHGKPSHRLVQPGTRVNPSPMWRRKALESRHGDKLIVPGYAEESAREEEQHMAKIGTQKAQNIAQTRHATPSHAVLDPPGLPTPSHATPSHKNTHGPPRRRRGTPKRLGADSSFSTRPVTHATPVRSNYPSSMEEVRDILKGSRQWLKDGLQLPRPFPQEITEEQFKRMINLVAREMYAEDPDGNEMTALSAYERYPLSIEDMRQMRLEPSAEKELVLNSVRMWLKDLKNGVSALRPFQKEVPEETFQQMAMHQGFQMFPELSRPPHSKRAKSARHNLVKDEIEYRGTSHAFVPRSQR